MTGKYRRYIDAELLHQLAHGGTHFANLEQAEFIASLMANELLNARQDLDVARLALSNTIQVNRGLKAYFDENLARVAKEVRSDVRTAKQQKDARRADEVLRRTKACKNCKHPIKEHRDEKRGCAQCGCDRYALEARKLRFL